MFEILARMIEAHWLFGILIPAGFALFIILIVDVVVVLRGGYSIFTPPAVIMLDIHMDATKQMRSVLERRKGKDAAPNQDKAPT